MRHQVSGKKLNRNSKHREAMLKTMVMQLVTHGHLTTTETKAKVVKGVTEKYLTKGKENTLHARRQLISELGNVTTAHKLIEIAANGTMGVIKSVRLGRRLGDNTMMMKLELPLPAKPEEPKKADKKAAKAETKPAKVEKPKKETKKEA